MTDSLSAPADWRLCTARMTERIQLQDLGGILTVIGSENLTVDCLYEQFAVGSRGLSDCALVRPSYACDLTVWKSEKYKDRACRTHGAGGPHHGLFTISCRQSPPRGAEP